MELRGRAWKCYLLYLRDEFLLEVGGREFKWKHPMLLDWSWAFVLTFLISRLSRVCLHAGKSMLQELLGQVNFTDSCN